MHISLGAHQQPLWTTLAADLSLKMPSSSAGLTKEKVEGFLATGIAIPILSLVKEAPGVFPPLLSAAGGALFIAESVKVRNMGAG